MISDLVRELLQAMLASSAAIVLLLAVRRPLRARFGAQVAYCSWGLVPVAMLAVWLPAASEPTGLAVAADAGRIVIGSTGWTTGAMPALPIGAADWLVLAWGLGVAAFAIGFAARQRQFARSIERHPGRAFDTVSGHGPALVGWWRSRIVLPEDFRERYSRAEQRLVLAHEIAHLRRGDIHAQFAATTLRCLFWFNPLFHHAAALFRFDQELACDATVVEQFPGARGHYGSAMLKTQLAGFGLPVGCHWQSSHPLKERIEMLKHPLPARKRKLLGAVSIALLLTAGSYAAWAWQPATPAAAKASEPAPWLTRVTQQDSLPPPKYPKGVKVSGKVVLELLFGADGKVKDAKVISSAPAGVFDQASIDAVMTWYISPALENGKPVQRRVRVPIEFQPDGALPNPMPASVEPATG